MSSQSRVAIVTGGASGIGFAFSQGLAKEGYAVVIADIRGGEEAAARLRETSADAIGVSVDVTSAADTKAMARAALDRFGRIDVLINNAGLFTTLALKDFEQIEPAEWMKVMEVNTLGPFLCAKAVMPSYREAGGGRIINVASTSPIKGTPNMQHYTASKGAVIAFTRSLARELGSTNVTVNAIAPGFVLTDLTQKLWSDPTMQAWGRANTPLRRLGKPEDMVGAAVFLASAASAYMTGQVIYVDGGISCGLQWPIPLT